MISPKDNYNTNDNEKLYSNCIIYCYLPKELDDIQKEYNIEFKTSINGIYYGQDSVLVSLISNQKLGYRGTGDEKDKKTGIVLINQTRENKLFSTYFHKSHEPDIRNPF